MSRVLLCSKGCVFIAAAVMALGARIAAQTTGDTLASVKLPRAVLANGQPLAPGTYTLRLATDAGTPAAGQVADGSRWIEFVQDGRVAGRELTSVVARADVQSVLKGPGPASGTAKVELLKGDDYLRIWVNRNGTHYLIHLPVK